MPTQKIHYFYYIWSYSHTFIYRMSDMKMYFYLYRSIIAENISKMINYFRIVYSRLDEKFQFGLVSERNTTIIRKSDT